MSEGTNVAELAERMSEQGFCEKIGKRYPTGIKSLDNALDGGLSAELSSLIGGPGIGKTSLALQIALNISRSGSQVLYFSTERDESWLTARLISLQTYLNDSDNAATAQEIIEQNCAGTFSDKTLNAINKVSAECKNFTLYGSGSWNHTVEEIVEIVKENTEKHGNNVFVVADYLNEFSRSEGELHLDRKDFIAGAALILKKMVEELHIPALVISAINRDDRYSGETALYQIKDSGRLEYNYDTILSIESDEIENANVRDVKIAILKHKDGKAGVRISCRYHAAYNCFVSTSRVEFEKKSRPKDEAICGLDSDPIFDLFY